MKIGELVKLHIKKIFLYCDTADHEELSNLMGAKYSKKRFDINYPFCTELPLIPTEQSIRYWSESYLVGGKTVRVSSQWFNPPTSKSRDLFLKYLLEKKIITKDGLSEHGKIIPLESNKKEQAKKRVGKNSRYRGIAIGNSQNSVIRNILSNLGQESFDKNDWEVTKGFFSNSCAYCGKKEKLLMEHVVPINRQSLGEHRLGNLVPSCKPCNSKKHDKSFHEFLGNDLERIKKIEEYMDSRNYVPLGDNKQVKNIIELAYAEVSSVADRYKFILNELFPNS